MTFWFGVVGLAALVLSVVLGVAAAALHCWKSLRARASARRPTPVVRTAPDGRTFADAGYTEMAHSWFACGESAPRYAALNRNDFMLGAIFEVAYEDPEVDSWMQEVYSHIRNRDLMDAATSRLTQDEQERVVARREAMRSPDFEY